jgi:hypothetical protein
MVLLASEYDQSRFLKAVDFEKERKFRIKNVTEELVGRDRDQEKKLVVWFTNDPRGLVLNRVNNRTIRGAYGDPVEGWKGKIIIIFPTMEPFRGKMGPAPRVRIPSPKQPSAAPVAPQPSPSGNGAAAVVKPAAQPVTQPVAPPAADPELEPDPVKPLGEDLDDEIPF